MTISYNWLSQYLPQKVAPEALSAILTSIGLEVESMEPFEEIKGGLSGLVIGQVLEVAQHPNADKLKLSKVTIDGSNVMQIVCGAPNVEAGQKVIVAPVGTTIYPISGSPLNMKVAKIRGEESFGMICAEDEIGLGLSHAGIMVLPDDAPVGTFAADYFTPFNDVIFEIGLTPNRADAMSHWGVARDVCAYLSHHQKAELKPIIPQTELSANNHVLPINVAVENTSACPRYSGVCIANVQVGPSPKWLQQRLKSIGLKPINNIVDCTNFILHETGQPLHAFDYDAISGQKVIVKNLEPGTLFTTLDGKERTLDGADLMICSAEKSMCIAGVFGGLESGVTEKTQNLFLESAFFDPTSIRKTSFRHALRTDAAARFEKGVDISGTVTVLKRAAALIIEIAGGELASAIVDIYPAPQPKKEVTLKYSYLKKLSGKNYPVTSVKNILKSLGFGIKEESADDIVLEVPHYKKDVLHPADIVEEVLRIDGLDAIEIPSAITITPSIEVSYKEEALKEKLVGALVGLGFSEILTNSITNSNYFSSDQLTTTVKLFNNLSSELNVLRPAMLPTALEVIAFNHNRKNANLKLFELGKTYKTNGLGRYEEEAHFCLYVTGNATDVGWKKSAEPADIYLIKGLAESLIKLIGLKVSFETAEKSVFLENAFSASLEGKTLLKGGKVSAQTAARFDVKTPVFFVNFNWDVVLEEAVKNSVRFKEVAKFQPVERDLAMVVPKSTLFEEFRKSIATLHLSTLKEVRLFDVFESDKLGAGKKSWAVNFTFLNEEKTLTDGEVDGWMKKIMTTLEKETGAEIRKQ